MPLIDQVLEGAALVARQAATSAATAVTSAATGTTGSLTTSPTTGATGASVSGAATATTNQPPSGTSVPPSATTTQGGGGGGGGGSSPLLFFVALGFGVVFTNLWIIVGVKYCFRYNARARQLRLAAEDGDQINLDNVPHPHHRRRRREKKLMTIEEVNEKFPTMLYKVWVASRAEEGLPTAGGIDAPSRANSIRSVDGAIAPADQRRASSEEPDDSKDKERPTTSIAEAGTSVHETSATDAPASSTETSPAAASNPTPSPNTTMEPTSVYPTPDRDHSDDEDDENLDAPLPPECVGTSGDTCAICIDTLENNDEIRGLTCGHAFHAGCVDPWLTTRRACCPLCKADYYTPKPRPQPAEGTDAANAQAGAGGAAAVAGDRSRADQQRTASSWLTGRLPSRFMLGPRNDNENRAAPLPPVVYVNDGLATADAPQTAANINMPQQPAPSHGNWMGSFRPFRRRNGESSQQTSDPAAAESAPEVTPSQLEAGVRSQ